MQNNAQLRLELGWKKGANPTRLLHEETFQREIVCGMLDANFPDNLLWNVERTMSNLFIPILHNDDIALNGTSHLLGKVKNELLPCLRSFTR